MPVIIRVRDLTKSFGEIPAVDHLDFTVQQGEIYGFLGQNGAGKSTTIRLLLSLIKASSGEIEIFGLQLESHKKEILRRTGAMIEKPDLYKFLSAYENLELFARMSGIRLTNQQIMEQLHMVGLQDRARSRVKAFSQGMRQRLGIAVALVHDPELIILDEPLNGLDPQGIADIRKLVTLLSREKNKTIFISSHLLSEMELVADSLLIIHKGKKIAEGSMSQLISPEQTDVEMETEDPERLLRLLSSSGYPASRLTDKQMVIVQVKRSRVPDLIRFIGEQDIRVYSVRPRNSLENYFLSLTAH